MQAKGWKRQTLANVYTALDNNLEILPVLNKIDLPSADEDRCQGNGRGVIGIDALGARRPISAKTGLNVKAVLEAVVERAAAAYGRRQQSRLKAMLHRQLVRRLTRRHRAGSHQGGRALSSAARRCKNDEPPAATIKLSASASSGRSRKCCTELGPGEVGFFTAAIKEVADTRVGDTDDG